MTTASRRPFTARAIVVTLVLALVVFVLSFHPGRPLYMQNRPVEVTVDDGVTLRGTISKPRWSRKPVPGIVLVHGSGPLTREHVVGDVRRLVKRGFAVLSYDKRGTGASSGTYLRGADMSADLLLRRLAADAAAMFDELSREPAVNPSASGFFGASQAGWIIPVASELASKKPRFNIILSGPAVSTGVEQYYSDLTSDGTGPPRVSDRAEIERLVLDFRGAHGFEPAPILASSRIPTLWLLGDHDQSVPTFASARVLDSIRAAGNGHHTVVRYQTANHDLRDVTTGKAMPIWEELKTWLQALHVFPQT